MSYRAEHCRKTLQIAGDRLLAFALALALGRSFLILATYALSTSSLLAP